MTPLVQTADHLKLYWRRNRALLEGRAHQRSWMRTDMDVSGNCLDPVRFELYARAPANRGRDAVVKPPKGPLPISIEMAVRCRKCELCLRAKKIHWMLRAVHETTKAKRTWFITLTLRPAVWVGLMTRGTRRGAEESPLECGIRELNKEITLALKRLRKALKAKVRFISALEWHKSGVPHIHMLLHCESNEVTYRDVRPFWTFGFAELTLVKHGAAAAGYVTKYIFKSMQASVSRVRASLHYGRKTETRSKTLANNSVVERAPRETFPPPALTSTAAKGLDGPELTRALRWGASLLTSDGLYSAMARPLRRLWNEMRDGETSPETIPETRAAAPAGSAAPAESGAATGAAKSEAATGPPAEAS